MREEFGKENQSTSMEIIQNQLEICSISAICPKRAYILVGRSYNIIVRPISPYLIKKKVLFRWVSVTHFSILYHPTRTCVDTKTKLHSTDQCKSITITIITTRYSQTNRTHAKYRTRRRTCGPTNSAIRTARDTLQ